MYQEKLTLEEIIRVTRGRLVNGKKSIFLIPAQKISTDTRRLNNGDLFIALKGKNFDGHNFVKEAWKRGACGAIVSKSVPIPSSAFLLIQVKNTLLALQEIAKFHRERLSLTLIGVTGSNGKTTVKEMAFKILSQKYPTLRSEGNFNNQIGVPLSLLKFSPYHKVGILEMGMNSPGEINRLAEIIQPCIGVITNIHHTHIGPLGSLKKIKEAKAELITWLNKDKNNRLILNADDKWTEHLRRRTKCQLITFGIKNSCNVKGENLKDYRDSMDFILNWEGGKIPIHLPIAGYYNVYNALAASAIALLLKVPLKAITKALKDFKLPPLHSEIEFIGKYKLINDSYNANPESMKEALTVLYKTEGKRKIAVLGDMLELGKRARFFHEMIGKQAGQLDIHALYALGKFSEDMVKGAKEAGMKNTFYFYDMDELVSKLLAYLKKGDCLLIKGSRNMRMEMVVEKLRAGLCSTM